MTEWLQESGGMRQRRVRAYWMTYQGRTTLRLDRLDVMRAVGLVPRFTLAERLVEERMGW